MHFFSEIPSEEKPNLTNLPDAMKGTEPKQQESTEEWRLKHRIKHTWHPAIHQEVEWKQWVCKTENNTNTYICYPI